MINLDINAQVIDLRVDKPKKTDSFFVDTNVWYWLTYTRARKGDRTPRYYQTNYYPSYIKEALKAQSNLYKCGLSLSEISHLIERNEKDIFCNAKNLDIYPKEYRHNYPRQRENVVEEIRLAWQQIAQFGQTVDLFLNDDLIQAVDPYFSNCKLDGYDLFMVETMKEHSLEYVITDDSDFATVKDITVFTANNTIINSAKSQGKLLNR